MQDFPIESTIADPDLTKGHRAQELFTNRVYEIDRFVAILHRPNDESVAFFVEGEGGSGKSLLLQRFQNSYSKILDAKSWDEIKALAPADRLNRVHESSEATPVPSAYIDLTEVANPDEVLRRIKRQLVSQGLRFPRYDFATLALFKQTGDLNENRVKEFCVSAGINLLPALSAALLRDSGTDIASAFLIGFMQFAGPTWANAKRTNSIDRIDLDEINHMNIGELCAALPRTFGADLVENIANKSAPRVVLMIDGMDEFERRRTSRDTDQIQVDQGWVRQLLATLQAGSGACTLLAGRQAPDWSQIRDFPYRFNAVIKVEYLDRLAAKEYLNKARIHGEAMEGAILKAAETVGDEEPKEKKYHPFYLGLGADFVHRKRREQENDDAILNLWTSPEGKDSSRRVLIYRFLSHVSESTRDAIKALTAARTFDESLFRVLRRDIDGLLLAPAFHQLVQFSFVRQLADGRFRIHDLMSRVIREERGHIYTRSHEVLRAYFDDLATGGDRKAKLEMIYHLNHSDPFSSIDQWHKQFDLAIQLLDVEFGRSLMSLANEMDFVRPSHLAKRLRKQANFYRHFADYDKARSECELALESLDKDTRENEDVRTIVERGHTLIVLAEIHLQVGALSEARPLISHAIAEYRHAISSFDTTPEISVSLGNALIRRSEIEAGAGDIVASRDALRSAVAAMGPVLARDRSNFGALNNRATASVRLAEIDLSSGSLNEGRQAIDDALADYSEALKACPDSLDVRNNRGTAYLRSASIEAAADDLELALVIVAYAIDEFDHVLETSADHINALNNRSAAYAFQARCEFGLDQTLTALGTIERAIAQFSKVIHRAKGHSSALLERGESYILRSEIQSQIGRRAEAIQSLHSALEDFDSLLKESITIDRARFAREMATSRLQMLNPQ